MKKTLHILLLILLFATVSDNAVFAKSLAEETESESIQKAKTDKYISYVYGKIKFARNGKLSFEAFKYAFYGYLNMLEEGKISQENVLSVCDFTLSSNKKRLWVIDLKAKKVLYYSLVAHGQGTGEEFATAFSNINDSHQSSLGFYLTGETYSGSNGYSLKLNGVDGSFNSNAYDRAIVIHGADYVCEQFVKDNVRLGRSHGCPALPAETVSVIIDKIKNGSCFFIYHTANNYLSKSRWLNSPVSSLPREADLMDLNNGVRNNPRYVYVKSDKDEIDPESETAQESQKEKIISSVITVNMNSRTGVSDTIIVK